MIYLSTDMKRQAFFAIISIAGFQLANADLTRSQLSLFFDHICFVDGNWEFKFSPGTRGMKCHLRNGDSDVTGACIPGQVLHVLPSTSIELQNDDMNLLLSPRGPTQFSVTFQTKSVPERYDLGQEEKAFLRVKGSGFELIYPGNK